MYRSPAEPSEGENCPAQLQPAAVSPSRGKARGSLQGKQADTEISLEEGGEELTTGWATPEFLLIRSTAAAYWGRVLLAEGSGTHRRAKQTARDSCWLSDICSFQSFFLPFLGDVTIPLTSFSCYAPNLMITEPVNFQRRPRHLTRARKLTLVPLNDFAQQLPPGGAWAGSAVAD